MKSPIIYSLLLYIVGCATEPEEPMWTVYIKNTSLQAVSITTFYEGELQATEVLTQGQRGVRCDYYEGHFSGYQMVGCEIDSMKFEYNNGKGYVSSINYQTDVNFPPNYGLWGHGFKYELAENASTYEFVLNEEDYENAHDLP